MLYHTLGICGAFLLQVQTHTNKTVRKNNPKYLFLLLEYQVCHRTINGACVLLPRSRGGKSVSRLHLLNYRSK